MAEVIVQEESLVTVADAIREKTGGTEELVFPTGFAEAIAGIGEGTTVSGGSFTVAGDTKDFSFTHTLGKKPGIIIIWARGSDTFTSGYVTLVVAKPYNIANIGINAINTGVIHYVKSDGSMYTFHGSTLEAIIKNASITETEVSGSVTLSSISKGFNPDTEYLWVVA